ncbi:hemerythrin domain-containing protein [Streptomyces sp. TRM70350]|uniref:hemerythrin domain-containing protein n=1 Tax=Streptomyces sp. TRM70350 TaxID=2856165 RepID=UPI001C477714|nr:hemerythrin domain-containing protein [Streptomyces sp. TRM70350]MBV7699843.1 hemerythrin domain-containing protein [Streptomyces sp. TRM70350]
MSQEFKNHDMTMMFAIHDALRRELERIARITARVDEDPRHVLSTAVGWELFKKFLTIHHTSEDVTVWPVMQQALAGKPAELALLDDMEAEHAVIDPLLADIDAALADRDSGLERLGGLTDTLYTRLSGHLDHEERDALQLMDITMTAEQWAAFSAEQRTRVGDDSRRYLPWLLDDMDVAKVAGILGKMPEQLRNAYETEWRAAYEALDIWGTRAGTAAR